MKRRWILLAIGLVLSACSQSVAGDTASSASPGQAGGPAQRIQWRALAAAGEDNAPVFDNAVDKMAEILTARGVAPIDQFTSDPTLERADRRITTADNMTAALKARHPAAGQGCLVFLTSHGSPHGLALTDDLA